MRMGRGMIILFGPCMRVQQKSEDIGRCACGRRDYCDGSHGLSETQGQALEVEVLEADRKDMAKQEDCE